jgi:hypothetical protein
MIMDGELRSGSERADFGLISRRDGQEILNCYEVRDMTVPFGDDRDTCETGRGLILAAA